MSEGKPDIEKGDSVGADGGEYSEGQPALLELHPAVPSSPPTRRLLSLLLMVLAIFSFLVAVSLVSLGFILLYEHNSSPGHHRLFMPFYLSNTSLPNSNILSLSDPALRDSIMHDLNTTIAGIHASRLNITGSVSTRGYPPTVPNCWVEGSPKGPVCRLTVTTWDSPGHNTAVLGAFDPQCNLIGYLDNAPTGEWVNFDSQLPFVLVTFVSDVNWVYFKYDGTQYGNQRSETISWEEDDPWYGNLSYEVAPFYCF